MGNTPEIVSKLQFLYHLEENKLELGEAGGFGWVEGEVSEIYREISKRNYRNVWEFPENGPDRIY